MNKVSNVAELQSILDEFSTHFSVEASILGNINGLQKYKECAESLSSFIRICHLNVKILTAEEFFVKTFLNKAVKRKVFM